MQQATTSEWNYITSWIGTDETQATFNERLDRLFHDAADRQAAIDAAIEESLRAQLTDLVGTPSTVTLPGGMSMSTGENMRMIQERLKDFIQNYSTGSRKQLRVTELIRDRTR